MRQSNEDKKKEMMANLKWFPFYTGESGWFDPELSKCSLASRGLLSLLMHYSFQKANGTFEIDKDDLLCLCGREPEEIVLNAFAELVSRGRIVVSGDILRGRISITIKKMDGVLADMFKFYKDTWKSPKEYKRECATRGRAGAKARADKDYVKSLEDPSSSLRDWENRRNRG